MRTAELQVRTPEGILFPQLLAGPVVRFFAWLVDWFCIMSLVLMLNRILALLQLLDAGIAAAAITLGYFVISIGYGMLFEWFWRGQTLGKKLFRLRVVDVEGLRLQFNQIVVRNLLRFVDALPAFYFIGGMASWLNPRCQRLGDLAANTIVVRTPEIGEPQLGRVLPDKFNSLRQFPHLAARLRQRVSPTEASLAVQALLRREGLDSQSRVELFAQLAAHFRAKVQFPPEATEGIADEQYLRNLVEVIYRAQPSTNRVFK